MGPQQAQEVGITEQTYYRWLREFGGLKLDQAKRLEEPKKEYCRLNLTQTTPRTSCASKYN